MTIQEKMKTKLEESGIPAKEIRVFGSQVMITCKGKRSAERFNTLLSTFCRKVRLNESLDEVRNMPNAKPSYLKVWRVWGTI